MTELYLDPYEEPRSDSWSLSHSWQGTLASMEIRTEQIGDYHGFIQWIFEKIPRRASARGRIRFT